jgi:hypothetical protein
VKGPEPDRKLTTWKMQIHAEETVQKTPSFSSDVGGNGLVYYDVVKGSEVIKCGKS